jgi:hypothetical protein
MKRVLLVLFVVALMCFNGVNSSVFSAPIDLSSWTAKTWDMPGGQPAGNWVLASDNLSVTQYINADPSAYLNNINQTSYTMQGKWKVLTSSDDDFMGFIFGYQNTSNFYLFDWKQGTQSYVNTTAQEGFSIKKISAPSEGDLSLADFWSSYDTDPDSPNMTMLASSYGSTEGWADLTEYEFFLDFQPGTFQVIVKEGATELWNTTVNDSSFTSGEFGFYNFSQQTVQYSGFEQTGGVVVPEPSTMLLLGSGLFGLGAFRKKFKK